jgi:mono/diheme cytochrome c family protein
MRASRRLLVCWVALMALLAVGCGGTETGDGRLAFGKEIYLRECARCHMTDGSGVAGVYPNLAGDPIVRLDSPEPTIAIVLGGREAMPGFENQLPVQELAAVMTYIRHSWHNDASPVTAAQAK